MECLFVSLVWVRLSLDLRIHLTSDFLVGSCDVLE